MQIFHVNVFLPIPLTPSTYHELCPLPDYQQYLIGSCRQSHIACRVMTRVIDHKPEHNTIIVDCGFTALSHDGMRQRPLNFCVIEGESNLRSVQEKEYEKKVAQ